MAAVVTGSGGGIGREVALAPYSFPDRVNSFENPGNGW
jgi:hypothetical protein